MRTINNPGPIVTLLLLSLMLGGLLTLPGCGEAPIMTDGPQYRKVLLVGIDGTDPSVISRLMKEGKLPAFQRLAESGSFLTLNISRPKTEGSAALTSFYPHITIATGVNPGKHGIFDLIGRDPATYLPALTVPQSVQTAGGTVYESPIRSSPLWTLTSEAGLPTTVLRWPVTFPPGKVNGVMLSGLGVPDIRGFLSGYTYYYAREGAPPKVSGPSKAVHIESSGGMISTVISGPKKRTGGPLVEMEAPLEIRGLDGEGAIELVVDGKSYPLKEHEWSDWIAVSFKAGPLKNVHGMFRVYLLSADPFEMYAGAVQMSPEKPLLAISYPSGYSADLARDIGPFHTLGMSEETQGYEDGVLPEEALLGQIALVDQERERMFWKEFESFKESESGLYAFVFDTSDRLQHVFWNSTVLEGSVTRIHPAVEAHYLQKDRLLGELLQQLDDQTLLLLVSDHGFTPFERAVNLNTWLVRNGFMTLKGELEEGDDGALFQQVDWSRTRAYSVGFSSIYINLAGREGEGTVEDREALVSQILSKLMNLTDEKYGVRPVHAAYRREEIYFGPHLADAPDIIVGFSPGYRADQQGPIGGFSAEIIRDNTEKWKGDHLIDPSFVPGVLFSNAKPTKDAAFQVDIAPTVLDALGVDVPEEMDGRSLLR